MIAPISTTIASSGPTGYSRVCLTWLEIRASQSLLTFENLQERLTELRKHLHSLVYYTGMIKDMIKDTDEQLDEETHRVRCGRVLRAEASVSVQVECITLPTWGCVQQPGILVAQGFYRGFIT